MFLNVLLFSSMAFDEILKNIQKWLVIVFIYLFYLFIIFDLGYGGQQKSFMYFKKK